MTRQTSDASRQVAEVARTERTSDSALALMASTITRASSAEGTDELVLGDGTRLALRPLKSNDRDGVAALFARLTPESRRRRFLSPKHELTPRELAYLTDIDHVQHEAIAAVDQLNGSIVGVSRYAHFSDHARVAEIAVAVADELQSMGIATALATRTVQRARANGFALLTATTLWENRAARALLRRLGFHGRCSHGSEIEFELELDPQPTSSRWSAPTPKLAVGSPSPPTTAPQPTVATTSRPHLLRTRTRNQEART
jgi:RimJ/RimL family protein N-acetyltransferase